jgi:hypothetical protein
LEVQLPPRDEDEEFEYHREMEEIDFEERMVEYFEREY